MQTNEWLQATDSRSTTNPISIKTKETTCRQVIQRGGKKKKKHKSSQRKKMCIIFKGTSIRITADLWAQVIETRRKWNDTFKE